MNPNEPISAENEPDPTAANGASPEPAADPAASATVEQRLAETEARLAAMSDAYLRAKAEAENTRRRAEEEMSKARKFAVEAFAESLLPVRDSLEAAIAQTEATREQVLEGVHATLRQLRSCRSTRRSAPASTRTSTRRSAWCPPSRNRTRWSRCCRRAT